MKSQLFFFVLLLYSAILFGQQKHNSTTQINQKSRFDSTQLINVNRSEAIEEKAISDKNTFSSIDESLPWILAFSISILFIFVNFRLTKNLLLSSEKRIQFQIDSNERNLRYQMDKSLEYQPQLLRNIIAAKNKQEWLNEIEICIANYLTNITFIKPEVRALQESENFIPYVEKVLLFKSKAEILLTEQNNDEKEVLEAINDFSKILTMDKSEYDDDTFQEKRKKLLLVTRLFFKNQQRKIKYI
jgi:hypothetical protein